MKKCFIIPLLLSVFLVTSCTVNARLPNEIVREQQFATFDALEYQVLPNSNNMYFEGNGIPFISGEKGYNPAREKTLDLSFAGKTYQMDYQQDWSQWEMTRIVYEDKNGVSFSKYDGDQNSFEFSVANVEDPASIPSLFLYSKETLIESEYRAWLENQLKEILSFVSLDFSRYEYSCITRYNVHNKAHQSMVSESKEGFCIPQEEPGTTIDFIRYYIDFEQMVSGGATVNGIRIVADEKGNIEQISYIDRPGEWEKVSFEMDRVTKALDDYLIGKEINQTKSIGSYTIESLIFTVIDNKIRLVVSVSVKTLHDGDPSYSFLEYFCIA